MANKAAIERIEAERRAVIKVANKLYTPMDFYTLKSEVEIQSQKLIDRLSIMHVLSELCDKNFIKYERGKYAKTTDDDLCEIFGIK